MDTGLFLKRIFDVGFSSAVLVISAPVQFATALAIKSTMGGPVLFRQERPGLGGHPFMLMKFRSMHPVDPARGWNDDASRLTMVGKFIRSTSIDELPTLWNVLKGEMSLVGPRPLRMKYLDRYTPQQARRHEVKPGLTGLAQVSGRNQLSWEERFVLDVDYIDSRTFCLDFVILVRTILVVLKREGVSADGHVTMTEFMGTATDQGVSEKNKVRQGERSKGDMNG